MTWTLPTRTGQYVVGLAPREAGLVTVGWGPSAGEAVAPVAATSSFEADLDLLPLEATALGTRNVHGAELVVRRADGARGARLTVSGEVSLTRDDAGGTHLVCPLTDPGLGLDVTLHLRTHPAHDVVEKWAELRNRSDQPVELLRGWGGTFNVPVQGEAHVDLLGGAWSRELTPFRATLGAGTLSIGSRQGITSHTYAPVVTVVPADGGARYGVALAYSGSWRMALDAVPFSDHVRVSAGPDDESGILTLEPGGTLTTPTLAGVRVEGDADDLAQAWHAYQATLARTRGPEHRPVVYNSWFATTFDVRVEHQLRLAQAAAEVGAEVFVVDDGWFRGRTSDRAALGDWDVDTDRNPDGLGPLADGVRALGLRFGLWVEPEAVSPDSDLYRAHPGWAHHVAGRPLETLRHQYVLNLGLPEVEQWVLGTLRRLLTETDISYLKWDMNRSIADGGVTAPGGDDWSWRHTQAYYRVLDALRAEFPHVTVEACAGGGGRIDHAVLARTDVVWPSDETGPRDRLAIQHGFLGVLPAWTMSSWVTDLPDLRDPDRDDAPASPELRFVVAMAGVLGIGADLLAWDGETRRRARSFVDLYRSLRPVLHTGRVRRHGRPAEDACAVQYTGPGTVVLLAWRRPAADDPFTVRLRDLAPDARYRVRGTGETRTGTELASDGLTVPWTWTDCDVVILDRL
ncbi:alpha-galactosidase [Promicromonospora thailandica]|uniref:Alpha-galactosidase n=1 Tax=Promicromonospora thailandica TaxID=765201 RepID=A0A9X2G6F7_9MICO|nr:alpha-galactosidase [Promicromonospora thailandica]MCP2264099.1 alpha-galactosidase [Promicromonospora thailandica]BFF21243.1 alpha-galactosidase [Promicromonospora thailandica]